MKIISYMHYTSHTFCTPQIHTENQPAVVISAPEPRWCLTLCRFLLRSAFTVDRRCFWPKSFSVASSTLSGENLHRVPVEAIKGDLLLNLSRLF